MVLETSSADAEVEDFAFFGHSVPFVTIILVLDPPQLGDLRVILQVAFEEDPEDVGLQYAERSVVLDTPHVTFAGTECSEPLPEDRDLGHLGYDST